MAGPLDPASQLARAEGREQGRPRNEDTKQSSESRIRLINVINR